MMKQVIVPNPIPPIPTIELGEINSLRFYGACVSNVKYAIVKEPTIGNKRVKFKMLSMHQMIVGYDVDDVSDNIWSAANLKELCQKILHQSHTVFEFSSVSELFAWLAKP